MPWIQIKLGTTDKKAEKIAGMLSGFGAASVTYMDTIDNPVYEPLPGETKLWTNTTVIGLFDADTDTKRIIDFFYEHFGDKITYKVEQLEDKDWVREWMDNFHPIKCGERLWICPSWCDIPDPSAVNVMLDPGLAFGTGTHPTTFLCLSWLDSLNLKDQTIIDFGCGSGILAVSALKLGAGKAIGIDIDPQAIEASNENALRNGVKDRLELYLPAEQPEGLKADFLVANILAGPLRELAPSIASMVNPGGLFAISGIIENQCQELMEIYSQWFDLDEPVFKEEWCRITGKKK
ncbi:ribosomal protein L11 methyltransferase [Ruminobacter amylophilus]|jgi:ribosomal protein L11 methyltransferase|uniref:Ribosomal protein L11 methyltransferase n=2 Tax=Ruminobacter TaxID=866 RepID=A0A662ZKA3_9GAMM|nr:50S ribosomal protein L11 methyltransferase [Ruminobacter amylophilus]SFP58889.1 ribosomal protein L11 methyltransferase [Ruminobacter amylophilus]